MEQAWIIGLRILFKSAKYVEDVDCEILWCNGKSYIAKQIFGTDHLQMSIFNYACVHVS